MTLLSALMRGRVTMGDVDLLILDEAHHQCGADLYAVILDYFYAGSRSGPRVLALTAFPFKDARRRTAKKWIE